MPTTPLTDYAELNDHEEDPLCLHDTVDYAIPSPAAIKESFDSEDKAGLTCIQTDAVPLNRSQAQQNFFGAVNLQ